MYVCTQDVSIKSISLYSPPPPPLCRHNISSNIWDTFHLQHRNHTSSVETTPISMPHVVHLWMQAAKSYPRETIRFHDFCDGPYCNEKCPERVILGSVVPYWETHYQIIILMLVVGVAVVGVTVKVWLYLRDLIMSFKQKSFLKKICMRFDESESAVR